MIASEFQKSADSIGLGYMGPVPTLKGVHFYDPEISIASDGDERISTESDVLNMIDAVGDLVEASVDVTASITAFTAEDALPFDSAGDKRNLLAIQKALITTLMNDPNPGEFSLIVPADRNYAMSQFRKDTVPMSKLVAGALEIANSNGTIDAKTYVSRQRNGVLFAGVILRGLVDRKQPYILDNYGEIPAHSYPTKENSTLTEIPIISHKNLNSTENELDKRRIKKEYM